MSSSPDVPGNSRRRLLPRLPPEPSTANPGSSNSPVSSPATSATKRQAVTAACAACRKRKTKCNAARPKCSACIARDADCHYDTTSTETHSQALKRKYNELHSRTTAFEELYEILQTRPERVVQSVLQRIRTGADVHTVLRHVRDGDLLLQLSSMPETHYRYEFPYIADLPASLRFTDNPYLQSLLYEGTFSSPPSIKMLSGSKEPVAECHCQYLKPYHTAEIVDSKLAAAAPSNWTAVCENDELMRMLLNVYFLHDYPWFSFFNKDLFLDDLNSGRDRFCSPLLVNAVLASACHSHRAFPNRAEHWNPHTLGYQFLVEAKRLLELELGESKLTSIQAALVMNIVYNVNALDKIGSTYLVQAISMANKLQLFSETIELKDRKMQMAMAFTAWGLYVWQAMYCFYFFKPPLIDHPPQMLLPDPKSQSWYCEVWIKYPLNTILVSSRFEPTFIAHAQFRIISNDMSRRLFGERESPAETLSFIEALTFYSRFKDWFTNLPESLTSKHIVFPAQLKLHMEYYGQLIALFKPLTDLEPGEERFRMEMLSYAKLELETLVRLYYLRHSFEYYDPFMMHFLLLIGYATLEELTADADSEPVTRNSLRSILILCAKGLHDQGRNYYTAQVVFRLIRDKFQPEDREFLKRFTQSDDAEDEKPLMALNIQSSWPIPFINVNQDPSLSMLENLVRDYNKMSLDSNSDEVQQGSTRRREHEVRLHFAHLRGGSEE